jgi:hypothetical protein
MSTRPVPAKVASRRRWQLSGWTRAQADSVVAVVEEENERPDLIRRLDQADAQDLVF